jgi:hypothetical protein
MRQNDTKVDQDQKVEIEISFKLYRQILLQVLAKLGLNFVHLVQMKVSEMKPRVNLCSKSPSSI